MLDTSLTAEAYRKGYNAGAEAKARGTEFDWHNAEYSAIENGYSQHSLKARIHFMRGYENAYLAKDESK